MMNNSDVLSLVAAVIFVTVIVCVIAGIVGIAVYRVIARKWRRFVLEYEEMRQQISYIPWMKDVLSRSFVASSKTYQSKNNAEMVAKTKQITDNSPNADGVDESSNSDPDHEPDHEDDFWTDLKRMREVRDSIANQERIEIPALANLTDIEAWQATDAAILERELNESV